MSARGARTSRGRAPRRASPARRVAFEILRRVEEEGSFAAPLLAGATAELGAEDRALCYELVLGVLRWHLFLDALAAHYSGRSVESLDAPVLRAVRLGLYQLRFLSRIPPSAAVNESVNLAHEARLRSAAGLVNAVLRRAAREPDYDPAAGASDDIERVAIAVSHPRWLIEKWVADFGATEAEALARANNRTPPVAFRVNTLRAAETEVIGRLRAAGLALVPSRVAPGGWRVEGAGGAVLRELAGEGLIYMQDEASQLVAHVLGARAGERVLDACAAPGSKTTHIAALTGGESLIVAGDVHEHRLRLLRETAERLGAGSVRALAFDAADALPFADGSFDRVLVDAPCSGTGTLRHNPEIRWRITPADVAELAARQARILANAAQAVRHAGGRLVYSTCSVEREENEQVAAAFLAAHKDFTQVAAAPDATAVRTWPQRDDTDGFFVAAFERLG